MARQYKNVKNPSLLASGFTLIELLLVIVILGIVISIAVSIINPARIQRRSQEAVLIAQVSKLCTALFACATYNDVYSSCNQFIPGEVEASLTALGTPNASNTQSTSTTNGTPPYSTYGIFLKSGTTATLRARGYIPGRSSTGGNGAKNNNSCYVYCEYDFATGASFPITKTSDCY